MTMKMESAPTLGFELNVRPPVAAAARVPVFPEGDR